MRQSIVASAAFACSAAALAGSPGVPSVSTYDDLGEGFLGTSFSYNGVTYSNANGVGGVFPGGDTFVPDDIGDQFIVERATFLYDEFPQWGSPVNALTFGTSYIPGDNLSVGAFARATLTLDSLATAASVDMAFYENGPWGGIVFRMDAMRDGEVVATDSLVISGANPGRDNIAVGALSVDGEVFDTIYLSATYEGQFSAPRLMIDNLAITGVPAPGAAALALCAAGAIVRRRR